MSADLTEAAETALGLVDSLIVRAIEIVSGAPSWAHVRSDDNDDFASLDIDGPVATLHSFS